MHNVAYVSTLSSVRSFWSALGSSHTAFCSQLLWGVEDTMGCHAKGI